MREIYRPIHSAYETLRLHRDGRTRDAHFNRSVYPANEQLTALALETTRRPQALFSQGYSR